MIRYYLTFIGLFFFLQFNAQYLYEIGLSVGGTNYNGDIGNELYIYPNRVGGSIFFKRNFNSRISARASYSYLPIADNDVNSLNIKRQNRGYSFSNTIHEAAIGIEFNYFDYDVLSKYNGFTPYIFVEFAGFYYNIAKVGADYESYTIGSKFAYTLPFGIGYKSKITDRLGYAVELGARYTLEDDLDFNNQDVRDLRFGNKNTNDWYFFSGVSLTYSFGRPPCFSPRQ